MLMAPKPIYDPPIYAHGYQFGIHLPAHLSP